MIIADSVHSISQILTQKYCANLFTLGRHFSTKKQDCDIGTGTENAPREPVCSDPSEVKRVGSLEDLAPCVAG